MSWRFRTSFKVIPGVRLNLSRSGLSASIGGAPFTVNISPRGVYGTASLPGSGISYRHKIGDVAEPPPSAPYLAPSLPSLPSSFNPAAPFLPALQNMPPVQEIRSASTELLTSQSLQALKQVIQTAYEE